ncbi:MAG: ABC transporter permease [Vicinamibacterales bacterium]
MKPPGTRLRALAARLLDASTVDYLVDPAIADMQAEYEDASRRGLAWRKRWICLRGYLSFLTMIVAHGRAVRAMNGGVAPLRGLSLDVRLALRLLVKHRGLTVVGTVAMAFAIWSGIGAFEFYTQFMHPALPLDGGARIVGIVMVDTASRGEGSPTLHDFVAWRDALKSVPDLAAYRDRNWNVIVGTAAPEPVAVAEVSAATFRVVRERPVLGRPLIEADEKPDAPWVVVIGHDVWQSRFESDPHVLGRELRLGNVVHTIVGVMPEGFRFPVAHGFWVPLRLGPLNYPRQQAPLLRVFGRLAPGATLEAAQPELTVLGATAAAAFPDTHEHLKPRIVPYIESIFGSFSANSTSEVFMGNLLSVLLVFLVCGNVALLMFARAATREKEILVRTALGAGRGRIMGQLFVEALVLAMVAAVIAVTCAQLTWHALFAMVMENVFENRIPFWLHSNLSPRTLLYAALLTLVAAAIAGLLPGLKVTRGLGTRLRQSGPGGCGLRFGGIWTVLIVMQVAVMAIVPTPVIAIYGDVAKWARAAHAGLIPEQYLAAAIAMDRDKVPGATGATFSARFTAAIQELERRLEAEPGVTGVTVASVLPLMDHPVRQIDIDEAGTAPVDRISTHRRVSSAWVALDFFEVLDTPILFGRAFHSGDLLPDARTVIVNQSFAQLVLGGTHPIGRRLRYSDLTQQNAANSANQPWYQIVGVVGDLGMDPGERDPKRARIYHPLVPGGSYPVRMAVHTTGDPLLFASRLRSIARDVAPMLQISELARFDQVAAAGAQTMTLLFWLFLALAFVVVLLSLTGIYAVFSFVASQRTREVGIRVALGGRPRHVIAILFRRPLMQVGLGILIGLIVADRVSEGEMVRVIALYACGVVAVSAVATMGPVRRALRIQPLDALRAE